MSDRREIPEDSEFVETPLFMIIVLIALEYPPRDEGGVSLSPGEELLAVGVSSRWPAHDDDDHHHCHHHFHNQDYSEDNQSL